MNSEIVRNFKLHMKDFEKGRKIVKQYIFTCRNCNREISMPDASSSKMNSGSTENILSLHLMVCEKYNPLSRADEPATAV